MRTLTCQCETIFDSELPEEIDLDSKPECFAEILSGSFMTAKCPNCDRQLKPELKVRLKSSLKGLDILALPEADRFSFYGGSIDVPETAEILIGFPELFERALILSSALDPRSVEVLKYYLWAKAVASAEVTDNVLVSYAGLQEDRKLKFHIEGLKPGELAVLSLPFDRYQKACAELSASAKTEPFSRILQGPYRSVRALEMSEDS